MIFGAFGSTDSQLEIFNFRIKWRQLLPINNSGITELFNLPTLMHNSLFINNTYGTLLSSTYFEH